MPYCEEMAKYGGLWRITEKEGNEMRIDAITKHPRAFVISACISIALTLGSYIYVFGSFTFSRDVSDWSDFGTYIGGMLGSSFSFFAFLYIVKTFEIQQEQMLELRKQHEISSIQTVIINALSIVDNIFITSELSTVYNDRPNKLGPMLELIDALAHKVMSSKSTDAEKQSYNKILIECKESINFEDVYILTNELINLCDLYDDFIGAGGSDSLLERYVRRHYDYSNGLHRLDYLKGRVDGITRYYPSTFIPTQRRASQQFSMSPLS